MVMAAEMGLNACICRINRLLKSQLLSTQDTFSRPAGGSQSYLISQNKSSSPLLSRASQMGQPG
ncbi:hypothetical protein electrica_02818 [Klebsiella electrica]|nr:hypothetical protein electrica_02818 [Klebsiella electrica]